MRANIKLWFTLIAVLLISMSVIWYFNKPIENLTNAEPDLGVDVGIKGLGGAFITPISIQGVPTAAEKREEIKKTEEKKESAEWIKQYTGWSEGGSATFFTEELKGDSSIGVYRIGASWRPTVSNVVDIEGTTENSSDSTPPDQVNEDTPTINIRAFYGGEANGAQISMDDLINITMILFQVEVKPVTTDLDLNRIIIESPRGQRNVLPWMETTTPGVWEAFGPVSPGVVTFQVSKRATVPMARATKTLTFEAGCDSGSYYEGGICVEQTSCGDKPVRTEGDMENPRVCCPDLPDAEKYMFDYSESGNRCKITCKDTNKYMDGSGNCVESTTTADTNNYLVRGTKGYAFLDEDGGLEDINAGRNATAEPCRDCPEGKYRANCGSFNEGTCVNKKSCPENGVLGTSPTGNNVCCPDLSVYGSNAKYVAKVGQPCSFECEGETYLSPTNQNGTNSFTCESNIPTLRENQYYSTTPEASSGYTKGSGHFNVNDRSLDWDSISLTAGSAYTVLECNDLECSDSDDEYRTGCEGNSEGTCVSCPDGQEVNQDKNGCSNCEVDNARRNDSGNVTKCNVKFKCMDGYEANDATNATACQECSVVDAEKNESGDIQKCNARFKCNRGFRANGSLTECVTCAKAYSGEARPGDFDYTECGMNYICNPNYVYNNDSRSCESCPNGTVFDSISRSCKSCLGFDVHSNCECSRDFGKYANLNTAKEVKFEYKNTLKVGETLKVGQVLVGGYSGRTYVLALSSGALALYQFYQGLEGLNDNTKGALIWMKKADPSDPFTKLENPTSGQPYLWTKSGGKVDFAAASGPITVGSNTNPATNGLAIFGEREGNDMLYSVTDTNIPIKIGTNGSVIVSSTPVFELYPSTQQVQVIGIIKSTSGNCNNLPTGYTPLTVNEFNMNRYSLSQVLECSPPVFVRLFWNNGNPNVFNNSRNQYGWCQPQIVSSGNESVRSINAGCGTQKDTHVLVKTTFTKQNALPLLDQLNQKGGIPKSAVSGNISGTNWVWDSNLVVKWDGLLSQVTWQSFKGRFPQWCKGANQT